MKCQIQDFIIKLCNWSLKKFYVGSCRMTYQCDRDILILLPSLHLIQT